MMWDDFVGFEGMLVDLVGFEMMWVDLVGFGMVWAVARIWHGVGSWSDWDDLDPLGTI